MMKWKHIICSVVFSGVCWMGVADAAITIRNGPSGNSNQENVAQALLDVLNTDGSFNSMNVTTLTNTGVTTAGAGTKSAGWVVADSAETTTENSISGTLTTFALPGSSTCYLVADVIGRAGTGTARLANKITGTFDRVGTSNMTLVGTDTLGTDSTTALEAGWITRWVADTDGSTDEVQLVVSGTNTKIQWIAHVRSIIVTTTGAE